MKNNFKSIGILLSMIVLFVACSKDSPKQTLTNTDMIDIDGNIYKSVVLGNQCWITKNLNVSKYRNGDIIPQVSDPLEWKNLTTGAWCYYEDKTENGVVYGKLYNWYAVHDSRSLAPQGWHIPIDGEWYSLSEFLGGKVLAGGKMKTIDGWAIPNEGATNESDFLALPGGVRNEVGNFGLINTCGIWWSNSDKGVDIAWARSLKNDTSEAISLSYDMKCGFSVRCVKDK
jgi:uncharacterized protein (TIGR02145 family)